MKCGRQGVRSAAGTARSVKNDAVSAGGTFSGPCCAGASRLRTCTHHGAYIPAPTASTTPAAASARGRRSSNANRSSPPRIAAKVNRAAFRVRRSAPATAPTTAAGTTPNDLRTTIRTASVSASVESRRLRFSGWNIASVFVTTGAKAKKPSAAAGSHAGPGSASRASASTSSALPSTSSTLSASATRRGSPRPICSPTHQAAPATA